MKTLENQVAELRQQIEQLKREIARKPAREAAPLTPRHGRFFGITRKDFEQGVDEFFEVDVYIWSPTLNKWRKVPVEPLGFIQARDWFLNEGETVEKLTKVKIEWYETTWVVSAMYCSPTDLDEFQPTPPPSPGETESQIMQNLVNQINFTLNGSGRGRLPVYEPTDAVYQLSPSRSF